MTGHPVCALCQREIQPGEFVAPVMKDGRSLEDERIVYSEDVVMAHADCENPTKEPSDGDD